MKEFKIHQLSEAKETSKYNFDEWLWNDDTWGKCDKTYEFRAFVDSSENFNYYVAWNINDQLQLVRNKKLDGGR